MNIRGRYMIMIVILAMVLSSGVTTLALKWGGAGNAIALQSSNSEEFTKLLQSYNTLREGYYQDVNSEDLLNGAIDGMVKSLDDPYSTYMDQKEAGAFHESISASFEGIGAEIREEDGKIIIVSPIKGSPAEKAGLKPNDAILSVDGKTLSGMKSSEAVQHIRGKKGSKAELVIQRAGETGEINVSIIRDTIPVETVYHEMLPNNSMGKVQITKFSETTAEEFKKAVADLKGKGAKGLVLDLRQNPGGLLSIATEIGDMLVDEGKITLQVEYRDGKKDTYRSKGENKVGLPVVALIDGGSASASEIMAGFLKESANVPLVGQKSFGKGTVQSARDFEDGSNIKFTTAKWLTPNGNWVHKKGIEPDYKVELPKYADLPYLDPDKELKPETFSTEIKTAQVMLEALGHHPGRDDGFFDQKTKEAVMAFQKEQKLEATGVISGKTTRRMIELLQEKIKKNDTQLEAAERVLGKMIK